VRQLREKNDTAAHNLLAVAMNAAKRLLEDARFVIRVYVWIIFPGCFIRLVLKSI
jgi:hypothetical protein